MGEHEFEFTFDFGVLPQNMQFRSRYNRPGAASGWPNPKFRWQNTTRQKVTIVASDQPIVDGLTDPLKNPFRDFRFIIEEAFVRTAPNGREIVVVWKPSGEPTIQLAYNVSLVVAQERFDLGPLVRFDGRHPSRFEWKKYVQMLSADTCQLSVVLSPDVKIAEKLPVCEEYWAVEHQIKDIPLSRYDLSQ
jgi:hypothetical protein